VQHHSFVLDKIDERIERLRRQRHDCAIPAREQTPPCVEPEVAEFVDVRRGGTHGFHIFSENFTRI
jgi:hypothetical protein